jgi:hypothetical protein
MDEESAARVAEKSRHGINAGRPRFSHHYLGNRGGSVVGHSILGRGHGSLKSAASGKRHVDEKEAGRAFSDPNAGIGVSESRCCIHPVFKKRGVHHRSVNAICAAW